MKCMYDLSDERKNKQNLDESYKIVKDSFN